MTKTDAIIIMRSTVMYKVITDKFKKWNKNKRCKQDDDANDKLHEYADDTLTKTDNKIVKIICDNYGVMELIEKDEANYGCVMVCIKERGEDKYKKLLYDVLMEELWADFSEEMKDKEYSDSECEESDEDL